MSSICIGESNLVFAELSTSIEDSIRAASSVHWSLKLANKTSNDNFLCQYIIVKAAQK